MNTGITFPRPRTLLLLNTILIISFWIGIPDWIPEWIAIAVQSVRASVALMVVIIYGWSIVRIVRENDADPSHGLVIGIFLAFLADIVGSAYGMAWRWNGRPTDWPMMGFWQFPAYLTTIAAIHHIAVPNAINGKIPRRRIIWLGVAFGLACLIAGMVIGSQLARMGIVPA